jgi:hypothetical protein
VLESVKFDKQENGNLRVKSHNWRSLLNNNVDANTIQPEGNEPMGLNRNIYRR